ncbi:MAG: hypothetical protein L0Y44_11185 [Phycisphaerales bacterium]|nr:hypothetical protein [Phycisphaerales bacterium]
MLYDSRAIDAKDEIGKAKQFASLKLETMSGRLFAKGCDVDEVDLPHARRVWPYILDHRKSEGAWVWRYDRDRVPAREEIKLLLDECKAQLGAKLHT